MARQKGSNDKKRKRKILKLRDGNCCFYCGVVTNKLTIDHIFPICHGGKNAIWNNVLSCEHCNYVKSSALPSVSLQQEIKRKTQQFYLENYNFDYFSRKENTGADK